MQNNEIIIYTDGGCWPNPGKGGWACILLCLNDGIEIKRKEISGGINNTTNNRAEIIAVLEGLKALTKPTSVIVYSDSQYVVNSIGSWSSGNPQPNKGWMVNWRINNWIKNRKAIKNVDLWELIYAETQRHTAIRMKWIRGHSTNEYNNRCDQLAVEARKAVT